MEHEIHRLIGFTVVRRNLSAKVMVSIYPLIYVPSLAYSHEFCLSFLSFTFSYSGKANWSQALFSSDILILAEAAATVTQACISRRRQQYMTEVMESGNFMKEKTPKTTHKERYHFSRELLIIECLSWENILPSHHRSTRYQETIKTSIWLLFVFMDRQNQNSIVWS